MLSPYELKIWAERMQYLIDRLALETYCLAMAKSTSEFSSNSIEIREYEAERDEAGSRIKEHLSKLTQGH